MIYQPRNVKPSETSIDVTENNIFSLEVQTNNYISAYQLTISNFNNEDVYVGTKQATKILYNGDTLSIPVNGNEVILENGLNYKWRVKLYQPSSDMLITYGFVQAESTPEKVFIQQNINIRVGMSLVIDGESSIITSYNITTGEVSLATPLEKAPAVGNNYYVYSDFIETIPDYVFYARKIPSVDIINIPTSLNLKYHTFNGVYTQENNVPIIYHQFDLYIQQGDTLTLLDTTGRVYSANLIYTYDAFRTGNKYKIQMTVENDMGVTTQTQLYEFNVDYQIVEYLQQPKASYNSYQNAIDVSWITPVEHDGEAISTVSGLPTDLKYLYNVPYATVNSLYTKGYFAKWESNDGLCVLPDDFNITMQFSPDENFFFKGTNYYNGIQSIVQGQSDDENGLGSFIVFINKNKFVYCTPAEKDGTLYKVSVATPPEGEENNREHIFISDTIPNDTKYITLLLDEEIAEIETYDSTTKKITFANALTYVPSVGEMLFVNTSLETYFYTGTNTVFVLSSSPVVQPNNDYLWLDNALWNDDYTWVEGGTSLKRICNHWWKAKITKEGVLIEEIYVS